VLLPEDLGSTWLKKYQVREELSARSGQGWLGEKQLLSRLLRCHTVKYCPISQAPVHVPLALGLYLANASLCKAPQQPLPALQ